MSELTVLIEQARARLPLQSLMQQHGKSPANGNWKRFPTCPYCEHKDSAGVFTQNGQQLFKCHFNGSAKSHQGPCPSGTSGSRSAWDEIGFLAYELKLQRKEAMWVYLKEAGVWSDADRHPPSVMPGQRARRRARPRDEKPVDPHLPSAASSNLLPETMPAPSSPTDDSTERPGLQDLPASSSGGAQSSKESQGEAGAAVPPPTPKVSGGSASSASSESPDSPFPGRADEASLFPPEGGPPEASGPGQGPETPPPAQSKRGTRNAERGTKSHGGGDDGSPPPPTEQGGSGEPVPPALEALRWFYRHLHWSFADALRQWRDRGLTPATCHLLGYRSNVPANKELLLQMAEMWPPAVLVESGLYSTGSKPGQPAKPNPQFHGMSLRVKRDAKGKKMRDEDDEPVMECKWDQPILIPGFDANGELVHLRPHKGMMKDKSPRFYAVRPAKGTKTAEATQGETHQELNCAVVTEGEFKSAAVWQVLGCHAGALPGITMAKPLFADIEEWLELVEMRQVVVGYDNEDKSDPQLPGYQEDVRRRYDAQIWARYLARQLSQEGFDGKVCVLPNEWRGALGKADWDGRLAARLRELEGGDLVPKEATKATEGTEEEKIARLAAHAEAVWGRHAEVLRKEFAAVVQSALPVNELWQAGLFDSEAEKAIKNGLENISYVPKLPVGGDFEQIIARRLQRLVPRLKRNDRLPPKQRGFLAMLAKQYLSVKGRYYILKALRDTQQDAWTLSLNKAQDRDDVELKRACEIALKGVPEPISDFFMKAHYVLNRQNGTRCRLVTLHNVHGVNSRMLLLPSAPFAQPSKFREWLLDNITGATWSAGERELNRLQEDMGRQVAFKDVSEITVRGYHEDSHCWFFGDVTYLPNGETTMEDRNGIVWIRIPKRADGSENGHVDKQESYLWQGYKLSATDHEKQSFRHGDPKMHPKIKAQMPELRGLFQELSKRLFDTIGDHGGYLVLGAMLAYAAGPEIYREYGGFPGLWLHGETRQGKSSVARWCMRIWGMMIDTGLPLKDCTKVGLSIALQQYGSLPVWLEEFQPDSERWMIEKIKNIFNRESGSKKTFDEGDRRIVAGAIVTGVATAEDAQLRSRFLHVQVAASKRIKNHYDWFQAECQRFYLLGRIALERRAEFSDMVLKVMRSWMDSDAMKDNDERSRIVHGAAYAAFVAMVHLLEATDLTSELAGFRKHIVAHCRATAKEVKDQVNVNQFWEMLLNALADGAFGDTPSQRQQIFKVMENKGAPIPVTPMQVEKGLQDEHYSWRPLRLYFRPGPVIDKMRRYTAMRGLHLPLSISDLRAQMRTRGYWVEGKTSSGHRQQFRHGSVQSCWCIELDKHELGYYPVSDEEFLASLYVDGKPENGVFFAREDWIDPRRGDLFAVVDSLTPHKTSSEEAPEGQRSF